MSTRRTSLISGIGFESFVLVALAMGCGSSTTNTNPPSNAGGSTSGTTGGSTSITGGLGGNGGGTANSAGGTLATGGAPTAGTGGVAVVATGGAAVTATGGAAVTATGGAAATATGGAPVTTGTGGAASTTGGANSTAGSSAVDCNPPVTTHCAGTAPPAALISNFTIPSGSTATTPPVFGTWSQSVYGGAYVYPTTAAACGTGTVSSYPLTQTVAGGDWNITGTVGTYSGLGLWWQCNTGTTAAPTYAGACTIDASAYTGISLTISGSIGPIASGTGTVQLTIQVSTPSTTAPATDSAGNPKNCGTCVATTTAPCGANSVTVPVTSTATTVTFTWAQLGVTTPAAITGISFGFTDPCSLNNGYTTTPCTPTTYPVNITLTNIQFTS